MVPVRGEGVYLWDEDDKRYLDFCSGIAVCSLGHSHPVMVEAIQSQAATLIHSSNLYQPKQQAELAQEIVDASRRYFRQGLLCQLGCRSQRRTDQVRAALWSATTPSSNGEARYEVITFNMSFHGRTLGSMAATGQDKIKQGFDPMLPGFRHLPFNDVAALEGVIAPETVAILLEPIQGEGGVNVATPEFLRAIDALCKKHDLLLFFDEVQAGFGRCGELMAWRAIAPEIEPDGISWAKGMGGGVPIGSFWLKDKAVDDTTLPALMGPGSHGSTYGGNPLVSAVSLAVLKEIRKEGSESVCQSRWKLHIRDMPSESWNLPAITEVRGLGLLLGVGLDASRFNVPEGKTAALLVVTELMQRGLLCPPAGPADTFRLLATTQRQLKPKSTRPWRIVRETLESP